MENKDPNSTQWTAEELATIHEAEARKTINPQPTTEQLVADYETTLDETLEPTLFVPEPFRLTIGVTYTTACKQKMRVVAEEAGLFLGLVEGPDGLRAQPEWYHPDGTVDRDFDAYSEQDPYDVVRVFRAPDSVFLIKKDGYYTSNNCIMSRDNAVRIALERGGEIVEFLEIMDT